MWRYILLGGRVHDRCGIELLGYICISVETVQLAQNIEQHGRRKDPAGQGFGFGISDGVRQRGKRRLDHSVDKLEYKVDCNDSDAGLIVLDLLLEAGQYPLGDEREDAV